MNNLFTSENSIGILFNKFLNTELSEFVGLIESKHQKIPQPGLEDKIATYVLSRNFWGNKELIILMVHDEDDDEGIYSIAFNSQKRKVINAFEWSIRKPRTEFEYIDFFPANDTAIFVYKRRIKYDGMEVGIRLTFQQLSLANHIVTLTLV